MPEDELTTSIQKVRERFAKPETEVARLSLQANGSANSENG